MHYTVALAFRVSTAVFAVVLVLLASFWTWFTTITYRAFKWQQREDSQNARECAKVAV